MSYDPHKKAEVFVTVEGQSMPDPSQIRLGNPESAQIAQPVDADALKRSFCDSLPEDDSFRNWARETPDAVFVHWAQSVFEYYASESWRRASDVIASLRGGQKRFSKRITMAELEASPAFQNLTDEDQRTAKWIVANQESLTLRARATAR